MISTKKLVSMATVWQKMNAMGRKKISLPRINKDMDVDNSSKSSVADKGHFVVYTTDRRRFEMPIAYLNNNIFRELLKMSEEEFGLASDGPITLPCDATFMGSIVLLIQRGVTNLEKSLLKAVTSNRFLLSTFSYQGHTGQQSPVCGY